MVTLLFKLGEKVEAPFAVSVFPVGIVRFPFTVVVPEAFPILTVVAAPPMLSVVAVVLNRFAVDCSAIRSEDDPPFTYTPFCAVSVPDTVAYWLTCRLPFVCITPVEEIVVPVEP